MLEENCGVPSDSLWRWEMQLGKRDAGIMPLLQTAHLADDEWEKMTPEEVTLNSLMVSRTTWKLLACGKQEDRVWLRVVRMSRISTGT
jgi:hypothetical protein